jgi:hypothetical protein
MSARLLRGGIALFAATLFLVPAGIAAAAGTSAEVAKPAAAAARDANPQLLRLRSSGEGGLRLQRQREEPPRGLRHEGRRHRR